MADDARGATESATRMTRQICQGTMMPIGGAEDKEGAKVVLSRFVELAGGKDARIAVIPTASEEPDKGAQYEALFHELGAAHVGVLQVERRQDTEDEAVLAPLRDATGIYITGGDQGRLVEVIVGTPVMDCIRERSNSGALVGGTSAGASILGAHMPTPGDGESGTATPRKGIVELVAGFGLVQDILIDQHFSQRGRIGRLLALFAANPGLVALGLDEDTAAVITPDGMLEVVGTNSLTILNGRHVRSDYFDRDDGEVLTVVDSTVHILAAGRRFDLNSHQPVDV